MGLRNRLLVGLAILTAGAGQSVVYPLPAHADSGYRIQVNIDFGVCLDADSSTVSRNGGRVQLWRCNRSDNQKWRMSRTEFDTYQVWATTAWNVCLDADNSVPSGGYVQLWQCNSQPNQSWRILYRRDGSYTVMLQSVWNGQCVHIQNGSLDNGSRVFLENCDRSTWRQFFHLPDGWPGVPPPPTPPCPPLRCEP
jgi:hypothetical protein